MKKHLQKYLFEEKVCNLVTEISSKETGMPKFICRNHAQKTATTMKRAVSDTSASPKIFLPPIRTD